MIKIGRQPSSDWLAIGLIGISSVLLGIWAVKHTIALRNILLVLGSIASIVYCIRLWQSEKPNQFLKSGYALPYLCVSLSLAWVAMHYLFFSKFPEQQLSELNSTWLRAGLATLVGCGTGLALRRWPKAYLFLWVGILLAFFILFYEYLPKAIAKNEFFTPDYFGYIFYGKFNGVLMGILCMTGLGGYLIDYFVRNYICQPVTSNQKQKDSQHSRTWFIGLLCFIFLGIAIILYSFVFIFDSRNGIGLALILFGIWALSLMIALLSQLKHGHYSLKKILTGIALLICIGIVFFNFAAYQHKVNKGWQTFIEDFKVAVQIDRYTHWQNPKVLGYPKNALGQTVTINNYERIAWGLAGLREISKQPLGVGVLDHPFIATTQPNTYANKSDTGQLLSTHSAWIELGLAFGWIYLGLIVMTLLSIAILALRSAHQKITILSFVLMIAALYLVGEATPKHGVEILYYFLGLLPALVIPQMDSGKV